MQMDAGLDTGPVLSRAVLPIAADETTGRLHDRLAELGAREIVETLANLEQLTPEPQPEDGVSYAAKIDKAEARIDWSLPAGQVDRIIRGLSPFPGAWCEMDGVRVKLLESRVVEGQGRPGQLLDGLTIACGQDAVQITRAQRPGKKPMEAEQFLAGFVRPEGIT